MTPGRAGATAFACTIDPGIDHDNISLVYRDNAQLAILAIGYDDVEDTTQVPVNCGGLRIRAVMRCKLSNLTMDSSCG